MSVSPGPDSSSDARRSRDFGEFVVARSPHLLRAAYLLAGDRAGAEDLVQNALLRTYLAWDKVTAADDPLAYTQRILYTTSSRMRRRRRVNEDLGTPPDSLATTPSYSVEERDELSRALVALPQRQRAVIVLRYYEDLSVERVAEILGCSVGTVKSQTSKALSKLRSSPLLEARIARRT